MKRFISLLIVALMLVSVLVLASCNTVETTAAPTTEAPTTTKEVETTTKEVETTTKEEVTTTKEEVVTTTKEEVTTTKEEVVTTTEEKVTTKEEVTDTTADPGYTGETTTVPIFARFDFGTKTYAEDQGLTSHEYLLSALSYNDQCVYIDFNEDSWTVWAMQNFDSANATYSPDGNVSNNNFSLAFNNMITYDFDDQCIAGYGSWQNMPYNTSNVNKTWRGYHQYMKIRLINNSLNNMMSMRFRTSKDGSWFTTCVASNMYFQGGAGKTTATAKSTEYKSYVYDLIFLSCLASDRPQNTFGVAYAATWAGACEYIGTGAAPGNNWVWGQGLEVVALEFNVLGAFSSNYSTVCDSRTNIKAGNWVEIDYILFGADGLGFDSYKSYLEQNA